MIGDRQMTRRFERLGANLEGWAIGIAVILVLILYVISRIRA